MSTSFFDIVVVGSDLSGLIFAAVAAKRGYRVLVVGQGHRPNGYPVDGFRFVRRPEVFHGLLTSPIADSILVELGLGTDMRNRLQPCDPRFQLTTPDRRVDICADPAALAHELEREFPGELPAFERYVRAVAEDNALVRSVLAEAPPLGPQGFRERRAFRRLTAPLQAMLADTVAGAADPLTAFAPQSSLARLVTAPLGFMAQADLATMPHLQRVRAAVHALQGFSVVDDGLDRLERVLLDKVVAHCGTVRREANVEALSLSRRRVRAVGLRRTGEEIGCRLVVCNTEPRRFFQLIPHERQRERFHHRIRSLQPSHFLAVLNVALDGEVVQEGMGPAVFHVTDPHSPLEGDNALLLFTQPQVALARDGRPCRVLSACARIPARTFVPRQAFGQTVAAALWQRVAEFVPFAESRRRALHLSWFSGDADDIDMADVVPLYSGSVPTSLAASPILCDTEYKNILVGGDAVFSGLGFEGAFLAAQVLLRRTARMVVLKSILHG